MAGAHGALVFNHEDICTVCLKANGWGGDRSVMADAHPEQRRLMSLD